MKRYTTFILVGIIILLAAVLTGVLVFMRNQPPQERAFQPLVEIAPMEPDSEKWGVNFPNQYTTFMKTETNNIDTTFAGSGKNGNKRGKDVFIDKDGDGIADTRVGGMSLEKIRKRTRSGQQGSGGHGGMVPAETVAKSKS